MTKEEQFKAAWKMAMPIVAADMETIRETIVSAGVPDIAIFVTETLVKAIEGACGCAQALLGGPVEEGIPADELQITASLIQSLETTRRLARYVAAVTADQSKKRFESHNAKLN